MNDNAIREAVEQGEQRYKYYCSDDDWMTSADSERKAEQLKTFLDLAKAYLSTPENWPLEKRVGRDSMGILESYEDGFNEARDLCMRSAMKGCPCCGVARIIEKRAEVPTVEWIRSLKKNIEEIGEVKLDLRVLPVLEKLLPGLKEKQAIPEEIIDRFEEASHSADNSTLTFKEKQKGE